MQQQWRVCVLVDRDGPSLEARQVEAAFRANPAFHVMVAHSSSRAKPRSLGERVLLAVDFVCRRVVRERPVMVGARPGPGTLPVSEEAKGLPEEGVRSWPCPQPIDLVVVASDDPPTEVAADARLGALTAAYGRAGHRFSDGVDVESLVGRFGSATYAIVHTSPRGISRRLRDGSVVARRYQYLAASALTAHAAVELVASARRLLEERSTEGVNCDVPSRGSTPVIRALAYGILSATRLIRAAARPFRLWGRIDEWTVGVFEGPWQSIHGFRPTRVVPPPGMFLADPCVVQHSGMDVLYVEEFDRRLGRGRIAAYRWADGVATRLGVALEEPHHLSFPFVFAYEGDLFMCPESGESGEVLLYRCHSFPLDWRLEQTVLEDLRAVDPVLFPDDGRWWLLVSTDRYGLGEFTGNLECFVSDSPLALLWTSHPQNPVDANVATARCAGLIRVDGRLLRAAQDPGRSGYGERVVLRRFDHLGLDAFQESTVGGVGIPLGSHWSGMHHVSIGEGLVAVDQRERITVLLPSMRRTDYSPRLRREMAPVRFE